MLLRKILGSQQTLLSSSNLLSFPQKWRFGSSSTLRLLDVPSNQFSPCSKRLRGKTAKRTMSSPPSLWKMSGSPGSFMISFFLKAPARAQRSLHRRLKSFRSNSNHRPQTQLWNLIQLLMMSLRSVNTRQMMPTQGCYNSNTTTRWSLQARDMGRLGSQFQRYRFCPPAFTAGHRFPGRLMIGSARFAASPLRRATQSAPSLASIFIM